MSEVGNPPPVAPEADLCYNVEAEAAIRESNDLARKAAMDPAVLAEAEEEEQRK
ncbi:MAG: hypothetical protein ABSH44_17825 [Bryobacteraceae bacterium]|jgi:hypothetical protein